MKKKPWWSRFIKSSSKDPKKVKHQKSRSPRIEGLEPRAMMAVNIAAMANHQMIDNQDVGYCEQGLWQTYADPSAANGSYRYHAGSSGLGENAAEWNFGPTEVGATVQVFVSWTTGSNRATDAPYSVYSGETLLGTVRVNQTFAPDDGFDGTRHWESLGVFQATTGDISVKLADNANNFVIADTAMIAEVPDSAMQQMQVDDGDAAFREKGQWFGYHDTPSNEGDFRYSAPGIGENTASFTLGQMQAGKRYQLYASWSPGGNRASNARFSVIDNGVILSTVMLNQRFAPDDAQIDGRGWKSLGVYTFSGSTAVVELSDAGADGFVIADSIRAVEVPPVTVAPEVVDDGDAAYGEVGKDWWRGYSESGAYQNDFRFHPGGVGTGAEAIWTFEALDPTKQYRVLAAFSASGNRASNSPFVVADSANTLAVIRINQRFSPNDVVINGRAWEQLGVFQFTSGTAVIKLRDDADGFVVADAIRLIEVPPTALPTTLVDDGDIGYEETGTDWLGHNESGAYQGDFRYHLPGDGTSAAHWQFQNLPDGQYEVLTAWSPQSNRASNSHFTIAADGAAAGDLRVNQRIAPADVTIDGQGYKSLGIYFVHNGVLTVSLSDDAADGFVIADMVRLSVINYTPTVLSTAPVNVLQGTIDPSFDLASVFGDMNDPMSALTFTIVGNSSATLIPSASIEGQTLRFAIGSRQFGTGTLRIRATDPAGAFVEATLPINVNLASGLYTRFYTGAWSQMPDFAALLPQQIGTAATIDLSQFPQQDNYGVQFSGKIAVPTAGDYTFFTSSDDGSRLYIDGQLIVENDGLHGAQERSGVITLAAGVHAIRVDFFQGGWDQSLSAMWEGPGFTKQAIPANVLMHEATNTPPAAPTGLATIPSATAINVAWNASASDAGIAAYEVYRDGVLLGTTTRTYFRDTTTPRDPLSSFAYSITAVDVFGNRSAASSNAISGPMLDIATGLVARSYLGSWTALPDFDALPADQAVVVADCSLQVAPRGDYYGLDFRGQIEAPAPGVYTFTISSDDGSRLWIDGQLVADNDGLHPTWDRSGQITLTAGMHDIRVAYFQDAGGQALTLQWEGPELARQAIPTAAFFHLTDTQAPQSPQTLSAVPGQHVVSLAWSKSCDNWITTGYEVLRDGQVIGTTANNSFVDATATPGVSYNYVSVRDKHH